MSTVLTHGQTDVRAGKHRVMRLLQEGYIIMQNINV